MRSIANRRGLFLGIALLTLITARGKSCGPFFTQAIFVRHHAEAKSALVAGRVGILWTDTRFSELALTYRRFQGPAFTPTEVKMFADVDKHRAAELKADAIEEARYQKNPSGYKFDTRSKGLQAWGEASLLAQSKSIPAAGGPSFNQRAIPGQPYTFYANCLDDAFDTAARTLRERLRAHANDLPNVAEWVKGQDAVFSNCSTAKDIPAPLPAFKPVWLQQDRAYQQAAAHFYRAEWTPAIAGFTAIAHDPASPWHELAEYLVARTTLRQAGLGPDLGDGQADLKFNPDVMHAAQTQFQAVAARHGRYAAPALKMLRLIDYRLDPGGALARLGVAISRPDPILVEDTSDLDYTFMPFPAVVAKARRNDLIDWIFTVRRDADGFVKDPAAHALARWHATHSTAWLSAALALAAKPDPELLAAAAAVPGNDPAWTTVTYYRLHLTPDRTAAHDQLAQIMPAIEQTESLSTINAFRELAQQKAMTAEQFMKVAALRPVDYGDDNYGVSDDETTPHELMGGLKVNTNDSRHFDLYGATVLNERVPTATLAQLVQQNYFPRQLQFEFAMAVWTRAVLLDKQEIAATLTPILAEGEPRWKPFLDAYDAAQSPDDRKVAGLLAMLRFPAVRPYINAGATREEGLAHYSSYRDNWWCANMAANAYDTAANFDSERQTQPRPSAVVSPPFVTADMAAEAAQEQAILRKIGDAPAYFGHETVAWVKGHPHDPRNVQLLQFTSRAMRNGCNLEESYTLHRQVDALLRKR